MIATRGLLSDDASTEIYVVTNEVIPDNIVSEARKEVSICIDSQLPFDLSPDKTHKRCLITFSTSTIISEEQMKEFKGGCWNIHPASYNYPGRDPHHYASYDKVDNYGACVHKMEASVDSGEILMAIEKVVSNESKTPDAYLKMGLETGLILLKDCVDEIAKNGGISSINGCLYKWGSRKTIRADLKKLCRITTDMTKKEIEDRERACISSNFNNLWLDESEWSN